MSERKNESQFSVIYLCFLVTRVGEKNVVDSEHVVLALTRLTDFLVEREVKEVSIPAHGPNIGSLNPRELHAILPVIFSETEFIVHLNKSY